ncbi:hypothetical protein GS429_12205 [Natronorubrum sp. JWXQ-INN-674]|uniref:Uncharacterized protein n=1 Tax=Natronorubrum halalkaliphilum TaxID=2691917 RepID=A0A6B0VMP1_9EURY|nr:hypothetical protein [Natronorubrum halalkaliphilum]MXV62814.1 hypothetical protein [Natronorubrum halalkaliphilum]
MDITVEQAQVVVDYDGTDYAFEVVGDNVLKFVASSGSDAVVPDDVIEELETSGYIIHPNE